MTDSNKRCGLLNEDKLASPSHKKAVLGVFLLAATTEKSATVKLGIILFDMGKTKVLLRLAHTNSNERGLLFGVDRKIITASTENLPGGPFWAS